MRPWLVFLALVGCLPVQGHIGSPNVFLERKAGDYLIRAVIRPPQVVPGLAEITIRVQGGTIERVTVLPVFWNAGHSGAPPPDEAKLVRGETNLYSAALWLMRPGAYSVEASVQGSRGTATLVVPVNAVATNTRPMSRGYVVMLSGLGMLLFLGAVGIAGAAFRESRLEPGAVPARKDRWRGRVAGGLVAGVLSLMIAGGKKWWDFEHANYRNHSLYKPLPVSAQVVTERDQPVLRVKVDISERRRPWAPMPDHGKIMHLFLVRDGEPGAFAHLHPVRAGTVFEAPLPPLPGAPYHLYAEVTHEDGFAETLTARVEIPPASLAMKRLWLGESEEPVCSVAVAQMLATNLLIRPDPDDSWQMARPGASSFQPANHFSLDPGQSVADAGGGYRMIWENPRQRVEMADASLHFKLIAPDGQIASIEPYMGMLGHAILRRADGAVFAHVHPEGSFSMAAQEFFVKGNIPENGAWKVPRGVSVKEPGHEAGRHDTAETGGGVRGEISFPYAFPQTGSYRLWVQTRARGRILTGVFDTTVAAAR